MKKLTKKKVLKGGEKVSGTYNVLCAILKELQAIHNILEPSKKKRIFETNIDGKSISKCVSDGITSAVQKSIRDTDVED